MARLGVTYQDIANAADQILGQGRQPTIELIRNLLGTGSTTTIANHLRKWRAEQDGSTSVAIKENLPQEFVSVMKGLWQRLQAHADNQIEKVKQEAEQQLSQLQQEVEKYKTNNQRWQKMHDSWVKDKEDLILEKHTLEQDILILQKEHVAITSTLDAQQNQLTENQQHIEELNRLNKQAQDNLEHYRESVRSQQIADQEKHTEQLSLLNEKMKTLSIEKNVLQTQQEKISNDYLLAQKNLDQLHLECAALIKENQDTKIQKAYAVTQYNNLQVKLEDQHKVLLETQKQNTLISQQLSVALTEVKELKEQNKFLSEEKWKIAQEKYQLEGQVKQMEKMLTAKELG